MKNVVELRVSDMSRSSRVFAMELRCEFWCKDFGSGLSGVVFTAVSFPLDCKGTPLSPPLNGMTALRSYPSLFTSDT